MSVATKGSVATPLDGSPSTLTLFSFILKYKAGQGQTRTYWDLREAFDSLRVQKSEKGMTTFESRWPHTYEEQSNQR